MKNNQLPFNNLNPKVTMFLMNYVNGFNENFRALRKFIPLLFVLISGSAVGQVAPCESLTSDVSWEIVGTTSLPATFCDTTAFRFIARTDSTYATGALTYQWQRKIGSGTFTNISGAIDDTLNTTVDTTAQYQCVVTCTEGGSPVLRTVGPVTITISIPTAGAITGGTPPPTICYGGNPAMINNQTAGTSATSINVSYQWQSRTGSGGQFTNIPTNANQQSYDPPANLTETTSYQRLTKSSDAINAECFSAPTAAVTVRVQPVISPGTITIPGNDTICSGTNASNIAGSAVAASGEATIAYVWEESTNDTNFTEISGAEAASFDPTTNLTQNTFYRRITKSTLNEVTCPSAPTASVAVTVRGLPTPGAISGNQTICYQGEPDPFTSSTAGSAADGGTITYQWQVNANAPTFPAGSWTNPTTGTGDTTDVFEEASNTLTSDRQYRRFAISTLNALACTSATATGTVQLTVSDQLNASFVADVTICENQVAELQITGAPSTEVLYSYPGQNQTWVPFGNQDTLTLQLNGLTTNTNVVIHAVRTDFDVNTSCIRYNINETALVQVISLPVAQFTGDQSPCGSNYTFGLSGTPNAQVTYQYSTPLSGVVINTVPLSSSGVYTQNNFPLTGNQVTTFTITNVDLGNCENTTDSPNYPVIPTNNIVAAIEVVGNPDAVNSVVKCEGQTITLRTLNNGTYQWYKDDVIIPNATNQTLVVFTAGNYKVEVTDLPCTDMSDNFTVINGDNPVVQITPNNLSFCFGQSITLTAAGGANCESCEFDWSASPNDHDNSIVLDQSTALTVIASDNEGCRDTLTVQVVERPDLNVSINNLATSICNGQNADLIAVGQGTELVFNWRNMTTLQDYPAGSTLSQSLNQTSTIRLIGIDGNNCRDTTSTTVNVFDLPVGNILTADTAICANTDASVRIQGDPSAVAYFHINGLSDALSLNQLGRLTVVIPVDQSPIDFQLDSISFNHNPLTCVSTINESITLSILPRPVVADIPDDSYCNGVTITPIVLEHVGSAAVNFNWSSSGLFNPNSNLPNNQIAGDLNLPTASQTETDTSFFQVWATDLQNCVSDTVFFQLEITPGPQFITPFEDAAFCDGETWPGLTLQTDVEDVAYSYAIVGDSIGITEPTSPIFNPVELNYPFSGDGSRTNTITVTATTPEGCETENEFQITVVSRPTMSTLLEQAFCEGEAATVLFSGTEGYQYDWQLLSDNLLGLPTTSESNSDDRIEFNAPDVVDEINVSIQVTPKYTNGQLTCPGSSETVIVFINPRPTLTIQNLDPYCSQDSVLDIDFVYEFIPDSFVSYRWEVATTNLFEPDSGDVEIATLATNTSPNQLNSAIAFTPLYSNHGRECAGNPVNANVSIYPTPQVSETADNDALCSGGTIQFTVNSQTTPPTHWDVEVTGDVASVSGSSGCEDCPSLSNTVSLSGNVNDPQTLIYTIYPYLEYCDAPGIESTYIINPNPATPQVISDESATWCPGAQGVTLLADTTADVVSYVWDAQTTGWGFEAGGAQGGIAGSQVYIDVPSQGGTLQYTLTAYNGYECHTEESFSLTVDPGTPLPDFEVVLVNTGANSSMLVVIPANDGQTYQWGALSQSDWSASPLAGETSQIYFLNQDPATETQYYYVDVTVGDCVSRVFYNQPTLIQDHAMAVAMSVFPNPFSDRLQLVNELQGEPFNLFIYDAMGREVLAIQVPAAAKQTTIETASWPAGTYHLRAVSNGHIRSMSLMKL